LTAPEHRDRQRAAHSMKSNSRLMGALQLSARLAEIEDRLERDKDAVIAAEEISKIAAEFDAIAGPLRSFAGHA